MVFAKTLHHQFVVSACQFVGGLGAYKANFGAKCRGYMAAEQIEVEQYLRVGGIRQSFQKISGEGGVADGILAAVAYRYVLKVGCACRDHRLAFLIGEGRTVFSNHNHEEMLHHSRCALHKIAMAESEGVAVHYNAAAGLHCGVEVLRC